MKEKMKDRWNNSYLKTTDSFPMKGLMLDELNGVELNVGQDNRFDIR